jgi:hypothetical protein
MPSPHVSARRLRYAALHTLVSIFACLDESWTRKRVWGSMQAFAGVFLLVMPGRMTSYQSICGTLFDWAGLRFGWQDAPDPAGLSRARRRLTMVECWKVFDQARSWAREHLLTGRTLLAGRCVLAADATVLHVPREDDLVRHFGIRLDKAGREIAHYPQALLASVWDLGRRLPIAWRLTSLRQGERATLLDMLPELPANSVLVLDRGYPGRDLLGRVLAAGHDVVMRMVASEAGGAWPEVEAFLASGKRSVVVAVLVGSGRAERLIQLRLVRRVFGRGRPKRHQQRERMVIVTSLTDPALTDRDICRLDAERWGIETIYREMKAVANVERWHGTTKELIEQEIIALMTWFTIAAVIGDAAERSADGHAARPNTRRVFDAIAYAMEALFMASIADGKIAQLFIARANVALKRIERWAQKRRPGRSATRQPKHPYARKQGNRHG